MIQSLIGNDSYDSHCRQALKNGASNYDATTEAARATGLVPKRWTFNSALRLELRTQEIRSDLETS